MAITTNVGNGRVYAAVGTSSVVPEVLRGRRAWPREMACYYDDRCRVPVGGMSTKTVRSLSWPVSAVLAFLGVRPWARHKVQENTICDLTGFTSGGSQSQEMPELWDTQVIRPNCLLL